MGGAINTQNNDGDTPLFRASGKGYAAVVQALLDKGAKIDLQSDKGATALFIASLFGHQKIVEALLAAGADTNIRESGDGTALKYTKTDKIKQMLRAAGATE
jgi:ankyrin repeat protein